MSAGLTVWARDPSRRLRGILPAVKGKAILRETGVATWTLTVDGHHALSAALADGWGVIIMDDGNLVLSGPLLTIEHKVHGNTIDLELTGVSDMVHLEDRITYPDPAKPAEQQTTVTHFKRKGPGRALIAELINTQAGPAALTPRRVPGLLTVPTTDPTGPTGAATVIEARFTPVLDEVASLARASGLVVDLAQRPGSTDLEAQITAPADRSRSVRFMPSTGLGEYTTKTAAPTVSAVIVGAGGEGTARKVIERQQTAARRVEKFQDRRDSTDPAELEKAAAETLAEGAATAAATFKTTEEGRLRFGTHYRLGDTVTVSPATGVQISDRLRSATIEWTPTGREVELTVGEHTSDDDKAPAWVRKVRTLQQQVRRIGVSQ